MRYEIAVSISKAHIAWFSGSYPCGMYADLRIFPEVLRAMLDKEEKVIADRGYRDSKCEYLTNDLLYPDNLYSHARARHEAINGQSKDLI